METVSQTVSTMKKYKQLCIQYLYYNIDSLVLYIMAENIPEQQWENFALKRQTNNRRLETLENIHLVCLSSQNAGALYQRQMTTKSTLKKAQEIKSQD